MMKSLSNKESMPFEGVSPRRHNRVSTWTCTTCFDSNFPEFQGHFSSNENKDIENSPESAENIFLANFPRDQSILTTDSPEDQELSLSVVIDISRGVSHITTHYDSVEVLPPILETTNLPITSVAFFDSTGMQASAVLVFMFTLIYFLWSKKSYPKNLNKQQQDIPLEISQSSFTLDPRSAEASPSRTAQTVLIGEASTIEFPEIFEEIDVDQNSANNHSEISCSENMNDQLEKVSNFLPHFSEVADSNDDGELQLWDIYPNKVPSKPAEPVPAIESDNANNNEEGDSNAVEEQNSERPLKSPSLFADISNPLLQPLPSVHPIRQEEWKPTSISLEEMDDMVVTSSYREDPVDVDFSEIYMAGDARDMSLLSAADPETLLYPEEQADISDDSRNDTVDGADGKEGKENGDDIDEYAVYGCGQGEEIVLGVNESLQKLGLIDAQYDDDHQNEEEEENYGDDDDEDMLLSPLSSCDEDDHDRPAETDGDDPLEYSLSATQDVFPILQRQAQLLSKQPQEVVLSPDVLSSSNDTVSPDKSLLHASHRKSHLCTPATPPRDHSIRRLHLSPLSPPDKLTTSSPLVNPTLVHGSSPLRCFPVRPSESPLQAQHFRRKYEVCFKALSDGKQLKDDDDDEDEDEDESNNNNNANNDDEDKTVVTAYTNTVVSGNSVNPNHNHVLNNNTSKASQSMDKDVFSSPSLVAARSNRIVQDRIKRFDR